MAEYWGAADRGYQLMMRVTHSQNIANNTSLVNMDVYLVAGGRIASSGTNGAAAIAGGYVSSYEGYRDYPAGTHHIMSGARVLTHGSDGTLGGFNVSAVLGFPYVYGGLSLGVSATYYVETIPRATTPNISGDFITGLPTTINLPRASAGFTHDVTYVFGAKTGVIATGATTYASWTPPHDLATEVPNTWYAQVGIHVTTRSGGVVVGTKAVRFGLQIASSIKPTVSKVEWADENTTVKAAIGAFVQGLSRLRGTVTANGVHGSTIASRALTIGGTVYPPDITFVPTKPGTIAASGQATDSRGRVGSKTSNLTVLAHEPPKIGPSGWQVRRANAANVASDTGIYLRLDIHALASSLLVEGVERNALTIRVFTRLASGGAWVARNVISPGITHSGAVQLSGGAVYPLASSFEVRVDLTDKTGVTATQVQTVVPTGGVTLDMDGTRVGVGKYWERGGLDVAGDIYSDGTKVALVGNTHSTFALKSQLDAWATAIDGTHAWVTSEGREYVRASGGWRALADVARDTAWTPVTNVLAGYTATADAAVCIRSGVLYGRGNVAKDSGAFPASAITLCKLPTNVPPFGATQNFNPVWVNVTSTLGVSWVRTNGEIAVNAGTGGGGNLALTALTGLRVD